MTVLPKPPSSRNSTSGWPAPEQMIKYFAEIRFELDTQVSQSKHDIDEFYPYPRAYEAMETAQSEALTHFNEVVMQYERVCKQINPSTQQGEYNMMMLKFFAQMGEHFKIAMDVSSLDSIMKRLYSL